MGNYDKVYTVTRKCDHCGSEYERHDDWDASYLSTDYVSPIHMLAPEMVSLYESGYSIRDIQSKLSLNFRQVRDNLLRSGVMLRNTGTYTKTFRQSSKILRSDHENQI